MRITVLLSLVAMAAARPQHAFPFGSFHLPPGTATGQAQSTVLSGVSNGATITQVGASAGGSASGNAASTNVASASNLQLSGPFGTNQFTNTNAVSNQQTSGGSIGFRPFGQFGR